MSAPIKLIAFLVLLVFSQTLLSAAKTQIITVDDSKLHVTQWHQGDFPAKTKTILLLSGPTDNWNSDSAWFARLAPKLAKSYRVYSIDRPGQLTEQTNGTKGYAAFGLQLSRALQQLQLDNIQIIAFASSNISLATYFANKPAQQVTSVIMIDPDVLTEFSIARYKKDAAPFKANLQQYLTYIGEGKYAQRAQQKNDSEMAHLKSLATKDKDTDWSYVEEVFKQRLKIVNLQNGFSEIALYDQDLDAAAKTEFPRHLPLTILDTDFESTYIEKTEKPEDKESLIRWQKDAAKYYQELTSNSVKGQYIHLKTREHLLPFSDPEILIRLIEANP